jgi:hypothetical protein
MRAQPDLTTRLVKRGKMPARLPIQRRPEDPRVDQRLLNGMLAMLLLALAGAWAADYFWAEPTGRDSSAPVGAVIG